MDGEQILTSANESTTGLESIADDVYCLPNMIVNLVFVGYPSSQTSGWVLVDTGLDNAVQDIIEIAKERFGVPPSAIVLTHGHFDHIGAVEELIKVWNCPVYAHELELPYLNGERDYSPPDPSVGGGLLARLSSLFPSKGINLKGRIKPLPVDGTIPFMQGWRWIPTPGHTPGHVSLFRESDQILIAGDAFTTVKQESALAVLTQEQEVHGPPAYFTTDWETAWESVRRLRDLNPQVVISGHGRPLSGEKLSQELANLAEHFDQIAIPPEGKYVQ